MRSIHFILAVGLFWAACTASKQQQKKEQFHIYLLMGQSNMAGRGQVEAQDTVTHPRVLVLTQDTAWNLARDPLHFDKPKVVGVGLGLTFGKIMAGRDKNIRIGLVPCAKGGSSIDQWIAGAYHEQTKSYPYDEALSRAKIAANYGTIKGMLWHQGESDTKSVMRVQAYKDKFLKLKRDLEQELGLVNLPTIIGELGQFYFEKRPNAQDMNALFAEISLENKCIGLAKSNSLTHKGDGTHFDSKSYRILGKRYAQAMIELQKGCEYE